jgi:geranylgeranyl transferase type-2 subunit beta
MFHTNKHIEYIRKVSIDVESFEYLATQHLRMSGVYWGLTSMCLLGLNLHEEEASNGLLEWVMNCQDVEIGGYIF